ncbi:MAG: ABC transporter ATP-binding protein [Bacteroidales bacterium]|nr:ABC transporter ATP-binding protein [Bacteroidales bacterium]
MINIENLKFGYRKNKLLFDDLNLYMTSGRVYGLLGKNGAGKTTLLKIISGLLYPQSGKCLVYDKASSKRIPEILQEIYMIPEEFQLPPVTIEKYTKINGTFYKNFSFNEMEKLIKEFELPNNEKLSNLSYGQKKKFLIAFGIATNAKILILDEPTNGLDIPSKTQFRRIIASSLVDERCFIISTHQVRDLESILDTILIIEEGKIIFNYPVEKISQNLEFKLVKDEKHSEDIIYYEESIGGKMAILKNNKQEGETKIELEILFNAVLSKPELFNEYLK